MYAKCLEKRCREIIAPKLDDTHFGFVPAVALQTKLSLSNKFSKNLGSMPKTSTHVLSTSRKHTTGFLVKIAGGCCRCTVLKAACYWLSDHCIPVQKCVSMLGELNQNRSSLVFDSDKGVFCHHSSS